jgi:hypothetical protein
MPDNFVLWLCKIDGSPTDGIYVVTSTNSTDTNNSYLILWRLFNFIHHMVQIRELCEQRIAQYSYDT